jgi:hypothetical protein
MKRTALILALVALCVCGLRLVEADQLSENYEIIRLNESHCKLYWGSRMADGRLGDDWAVTNLTTKPFTLTAVNPSGRSCIRLRRGKFVFRANPRWTATVRNKMTKKETTLSISDRVSKTVRFGTNDYFVVDIRISDQEVVLMETNSNTMVILHGVASNKTEHIEQNSGTYP